MSVKRSLGTQTPGTLTPSVVRKKINDYVKAGDEHAGFEATLDKPHRMVRLRLWGHWTMAIAEEFCSTIIRFGEEFGGQRWGILTDSRQFTAQAPNVAQIRQETMARLATMGCKKIAAIVQQVVYAMQFRRITDESHVPSAVFYDEKTALAWLADDETRPR